jgi:hypothetical protein
MADRPRATRPPPAPPALPGRPPASGYWRPYHAPVSPEVREEARRKLRQVMAPNRFRLQRDTSLSPDTLLGGQTDPRDYLGFAVDAFNRDYGAGKRIPLDVRDQTWRLLPDRLGQAYRDDGSIGMATRSLEPDGRGGAVEAPRSLSDIYDALLHEVGHHLGLEHAQFTPPGRLGADDVSWLSSLLHQDIDLPREPTRFYGGPDARSR